MNKPIEIWPVYKEAPIELQQSCFGGDEEGIAVIPKGIEIPRWMERIFWNEGGDPPQIIDIENAKIIIWTHA